ncbi:uncharacterized protein LOC131175839 [Hevea brasiliensis]|uniref:uncharacterized protein LOC131175839 n=1 Tax=Hevea brasiliensis TaxID=3981 RepID=UPI0025F6F91E|nr:uncharacterized protein LOC131175839 [Hevea brasiliensis]
MPSYTKFLKEILSKKRKLEDYETVALTEECSAILQNKLPPKLKDPGSFSIPCLISNMKIDKTLCDLGASVSLMPLSICQKLEVGELKPTTILLQLADQSVKYPEGILENIPIKVGKFFIPVDFIVLEMEEDVQIPIILGRPFLAITGAIIDVKNGRLTLKVGDEEVEFNLFSTMKHKLKPNECFKVDIVDKIKEALISAPIMQPPNWELPFEIVCDASDYAIGVVLRQRKDKKLHAIYYASRTLDDAQINYATIEKEFLAVVFAIDKFISYLLGSKVIVYIDHTTIREAEIMMVWTL